MTQAPEDRVDGTLLRLVGVMVLGGMLSFLDATIVNTGIYTLTDAFHASLATIEWVATGYLLAALTSLETAVAAAAPDDPDRARAAARLRAALSRLSEPHDAAPEIESATADEVFAFIDNELGRNVG